ncbi:hypothetical protein QJS10_CPB20g01366 [Acorus calamus]|uniref:peptide-methionine (S)-S-oxide reductase n=1 Tax=Acorus calamus TaxID=4465 RepID=A0AAV9CBU7_ACOCL|nr:hypothetical protein QJS10_CPB20g01366 [Acorus calamus]
MAELHRVVEELCERESRLRKELLEHKILKETIAIVPFLKKEIAFKDKDLAKSSLKIDGLKAKSETLRREIKMLKNKIDDGEARDLKLKEMETENLKRFGNRATNPTVQMDSSASDSVAQGPDEDKPSPGLEFAEFAAGCFWGVELAFQRVPGVIETEVGYTQGVMHNPTYEDVCTDKTNHSEVVRLQYDPRQCSFDDLLNVFWAKHDPTSVNRQIP